ncbi:hypothetical protein NQT69_11115 [Pseudoalteromonas shioyasakiensis]|uniref:hypothetical protein n=1 Tax=Pseudoalteromonas shioyasakiensis TaxID=1190813 RepID=UPI002118780F|nr:hypothetical protein [Pseudoalteromonas shioyasakiensis]MCQ8878552.1 hypothetical protein [Pseudoalteromonas shioyasakiensis]
METKINDEENATKVAGTFSTKAQADKAYSSLAEEPLLELSNLNIIAPHDQQFAEKVEPEDKNIAKTLLRTHLIYAAFGLAAGLLLSTAFYFLDVTFIQSFVLETYAGVCTITVFIALLIAGFVSIRPDHDPLINEVRQAIRAGKWVVIVHTDSNQKGNKAKQLLQPLAGSVTATF